MGVHPCAVAASTVCTASSVCVYGYTYIVGVYGYTYILWVYGYTHRVGVYGYTHLRCSCSSQSVLLAACVFMGIHPCAECCVFMGK